ncbi:TRAP transporter small permease subunit [Algihabitans albus]|uniref:TRAP transporter small permease subunit n=1 Tax=Algihabitans albus TaxID=2164067 RepID=UPI0013C34AFA|nr:TRAP transporter small permease subunit [Algihabitans albus]
MPPVVERFVLALGRVLAWGFLAIVALMVYEVVARYAFNAPTFWAHEISGILAAVAFVFGGAYCMAEGSHLRIGIAVDGAGRRFRLIAKTLGLFCGLLYLGGLTLAMWPIVQKSLFRFTPDGLWMPERSGTSWNTPAPSFVKFALLLGAALFALVVIVHLVRVLRGRSDATVPDGGGES